MNEKIIIRRLVVGAYLETLNKNFKSCMFYLSEISRLLKNNSKENVKGNDVIGQESFRNLLII